MQNPIDVELFYDLRSHRARACWDEEDRVLPDSFATREAAEAAARKLVADSLISEGNGAAMRAIRVWLR